MPGNPNPKSHLKRKHEGMHDSCTIREGHSHVLICVLRSVRISDEFKASIRDNQRFHRHTV
eukprot:10965682-Karenia_brevis.AAC.1